MRKVDYNENSVFKHDRFLMSFQVFIYTFIYPNLPRNSQSNSHPQSGDSQGQETFLTPSTDKQTHNYDTEQSAQTTTPPNHHRLLRLSSIFFISITCPKVVCILRYLLHIFVHHFFFYVPIFLESHSIFSSQIW